jgi:hypothetical protein
MKCHYILPFVILILSGCSAEWHLSKAVYKNPSILKPRTMIVTDTVVTDPIAVRDTVTTSQVDTVEIIKDKFRVKIMRSYDTLIIDGGCDSDTIVRTVRVEVPVVEYKERNGILDSMYRGSFYVLLFGILVFIVKDLINKRF